ncbi:MAG: ribbon-helix-helix protein, CopG family [Chloroflexi bacterium]|nr:ribbon-helix-helix protein, CopG family [Ardenticatenaceae bacterium]NOG37218.1 ribbon-helix-helix protein, CopG family [Chloroflexota bacterium]
METLTISLDDDLAIALKKLTKKTKLPQEELVRRAIAEYVAPQDDPLIGLFDLHYPDLAEKSEEILREAITSHSGWTIKQ